MTGFEREYQDDALHELKCGSVMFEATQSRMQAGAPMKRKSPGLLRGFELKPIRSLAAAKLTLPSQPGWTPFKITNSACTE